MLGFKKIVRSSIICSMALSAVILTSPDKTHAETTPYNDTVLLNCFLVSGGKAVYTPVALDAQVIVDKEYANAWKVTRWDLSGRVLATSFSAYQGSLYANTLNIRGTDHSLPNTSSYYSDPNFVTKGKNWTGTEWYNSSVKACYGQTVFTVSPSKGYQTNNTAQVNFNF